MNDTLKSAIAFLVFVLIGGVIGYLINGDKTVTKTEIKTDTLIVRDTLILEKVIPVIDSLKIERIDTVFADSSRLIIIRYPDPSVYDLEYIRRDSLLTHTITLYKPEYVSEPFYMDKWFYTALGAIAAFFGLLFYGG